MHFDYEGHHAILSTGTRFYAHGNVFGLSEECDELLYGWDGRVGDFGEGEDLTQHEKREIADEMIRRWTKWAAACPIPEPSS